MIAGPRNHRQRGVSGRKRPLTGFVYPDFTQELVRDTAGERSREARRCYSAHDAGLLAQFKTSHLTARGASAYGCGGVSLSAARTTTSVTPLNIRSLFGGGNTLLESRRALSTPQ